MSKLKKVLAIFCCCIVLTVVLSSIAYATSTVPYGSYDVYIKNGWFGGDDTATATISRCSCSPVDNWLAACIRIQYHEDGTYYWTPETNNEYYTNRGYNKDDATASYSHKNITYATAYFEARCGTGDMKVYYDNATN